MKKKGLLMSSILLTFCMFILTGYRYLNPIELRTDHVIVELGEKIDNNVATYVKGEIENLTLDLSKVNSNKIGEYQATIQNEDQKVDFTIYVKDTINPTATVVNNLSFRLNGIIKAKNLVKNIIDKSDVNVTFSDGQISKTFRKSGIVTETIILTDEGHNITKMEVKFKVIADTTKPKLKGIKNRTIFVGDKFNYLAKVTATDNWDGNITKKIKVNNKKVNLKKAGVYIVTYSVCDSSGNKAIKKMKLTVKKDKAPVLMGIKNQTVYLNNSINYLNGVKAIDDRDGNITKKIKVKSNVNISKVGTYKVTYTVTDSRGHTAKKTITVKVKEFKFFDVSPSGGKEVDGDIDAGGEHNVGTW